MNIIYFIRLLLRNALLLIIVPLLLVGIVFSLTKHQSRTYISTTKVYTGFTTGSSIVSLQDSKVDLFGSRAAFDNLISIITSRNTIEDAGLKLFTSHMLLEKPTPEVISKASYNHLMSIVPKNVKELVVKGNFDKTYNNFLRYKNQDLHNFIYGLINFESPHYSAKKIRENLKVQRLQSSDLVEIVFSSDDPGICYNTLLFINDLFIKAHSELQINQSGAVAKYFETQLEGATKKLKDAEDELLKFNQAGNIINYYEQTKHIASEKENFSLAYSNIRMEYASAASVIHVLEAQMTPRLKTLVNSAEILGLRDKLAEISLKISVKETQLDVGEKSDEKIIKELSDLRLQAFNLQSEIKNKVQESYDLQYTKEGVSTAQLVQDWLDQIVLLESTKAKLKVGDQRLEEFNDIFARYAPMGATMKSLERKIDVTESEYLSLLNSLGLAKLKQQNVELNSNLKVIEQPLFPLSPQPGKRKFLLIIAFMVGFIIPAFLIIVLDFLDNTIKTAARAEKFTGLSVLSIFPNFLSCKRSTSANYLNSKSLDIVARKLILRLNERQDKSIPFISVVYSNQAREGKSFLITSLLQKMNVFGYNCLFLTYDNIIPDGFKYVKYAVKNNFQSIERIEEFSDEVKTSEIKNFDFIFVEIPGIINENYPILLLKNVDKLFFVLRANRSWDKADDNALKELLSFGPKSAPQILLNGVQFLEMETLLGELPRKRSFVRSFGKKILQFQFFSKQDFSKVKKG